MTVILSQKRKLHKLTLGTTRDPTEGETQANVTPKVSVALVLAVDGEVGSHNVVDAANAR